MRSRYDDRLVAEMTASMQGVHLPSTDTAANGNRSQPSVAKQEQRPGAKVESKPKQSPVATAPPPRRPYDDVKEAGPAANPIDFSRPTIDRGRRGDVLCYNQLTGAHDVAKNVLFRDYSQHSTSDENLDRVQRAYWPLPFKQPIDTIMGHVSICLVLTRCKKERNDMDSSSDDSDQESEEDIVFQTTTEYVAVKVNYCDRMERLKNRHAEDPLKEIAALQLIGNGHPNVLGCHEVLFDGANVNVVLPFCGSGDLFQLLQDNLRLSPDTPGLSEAKARYWFRQVAAGIKHLHSIGVCHRDLSPENVMIDHNRCAVIDMGMCLRMPYTDPNGSTPDSVTDVRRGIRRRMIKPQGTCGKLPYMSPEIYVNKEAFDGGAIDVWTAGTILFCMVTGNRSYQKPHVSDPQFYWMTRGLTTLLKDWGVSLSPEGVHLLQNMLQVDPRLRLTIDEVLAHPWFAQPDERISHFHSI